MSQSEVNESGSEAVAYDVIAGILDNISHELTEKITKELIEAELKTHDAYKFDTQLDFDSVQSAVIQAQELINQVAAKLISWSAECVQELRDIENRKDRSGDYQENHDGGE